MTELRENSRPTNYDAIRNRCSNAYLGDGRSLCRVLGRYKIQVDTTDVGLSSHLLLDGIWEIWVVELLLSRIKPGMTVVDAGANLGYFTLLMSDLVGPGGRVHAFEPNPAMTARLRASVAINGFDSRVVVHEVGLSDRCGNAFIAVPPGEPKNGHIVDHDHRAERLPISLRRMDEIDGLNAVDFIKIDVEGSEERVWKGMRGILRRDRPLTVLLEYTAARYADARAFIDEILSYGLRLQHLTLADGVQPMTVDELMAKPPHEDQMILLTR